MPVLSFDEFKGGLDVRQHQALTRGSIMRALTNAYVTTGKSIRKRPCLTHVATLEAGTVGLRAINGKLRTFYGDGTAITHANTLFVAERVPHPTLGDAPVAIQYGDQFNRLPYISAEYANGDVYHHFLDDPGVWVASTAYSSGDYRRPINPNGFRYECTTAGTTAGVEPVWPTTIGTTVADGSAVWTCRSFSITDVNCPHSKQVTKRKQKIYAANEGDVSYCATGDPRDWTTASDAGFLPSSISATGSAEVTALGDFSESLVVFYADSSQVWSVSADPAENALTNVVENVGTLYHNAHMPLAGDLFFLAPNGVRSISLAIITNNLQDEDVGNAIDSLVNANIGPGDEPMAMYYPSLGQWWLINGTTVWVYSFSKTAKLSAWSKFTLPYSIDHATILNQQLYLRSGDLVFRVDGSVYKDYGPSIPLMDVLFYYQDADRPGVLKQFMGMDVMGLGQMTISHKFFDEAGAERETQEYEYQAITEPGPLHPVELCATRIAPHIQHQRDEECELSQINFFYENLGVL